MKGARNDVTEGHRILSSGSYASFALSLSHQLLQLRDRLVRLVRDRRVIEQLEVGAAARQRPEPRSRGELQKQIALLLVERRECFR